LQFEKKKKFKFCRPLFFQKWSPSLKIECQVPERNIIMKLGAENQLGIVVLYTNWIRVAHTKIAGTGALYCTTSALAFRIVPKKK
jgi:hypothetical protein